MKINNFHGSLVLALALVLASGCAANYQVVTNAYLDRSSANTGLLPAGKSYFVASNPNVPNSIFDNEVRSKIENLLVSKGYRLAPAEEANFTLKFKYDITVAVETDYRPQFVTTEPVVQHVYVRSSNKYYQIVTPSYTYVTHVPMTEKVYTARLFVSVLNSEVLRTGEERSVWIGDTINVSRNPDLRDSIDYLLVGTFKYFGQDTGKNKEVTLPQYDTDVARLRQPLNFSGASAGSEPEKH